MKCFPAVFYFNTSHVYINHPLQSLDCTWYHYFNTSHVYINRHIEKYAGSWKLISIHLMFILIYTWQLGEITSKISIHLMFILITEVPKVITYRQPAIISIHLMFILISYVRRCRRRWESISIHLMFILISFKTSSKGLSIIISIHLMFILIEQSLCIRVIHSAFQYISCLY